MSKRADHLRPLMVFAICVMMLGGCGTLPAEEQTPSTEDQTLTVSVNEWNASGGGPEDVFTYSDLKAGDEVYNGFGSVIKVKSISAKKVDLGIDGCLVEPNEDGTINLNKDPLKKIRVKSGETVELVSQTMDAGVTLKIEYH